MIRRLVLAALALWLLLCLSPAVQAQTPVQRAIDRNAAGWARLDSLEARLRAMRDTMRTLDDSLARLQLRADSLARKLGAAVAYIQERERRDSVRRAQVDSLEREAVRVRVYRAQIEGPAIKRYALTLAAGDLANALLHVDVDRGGYRDAWGTPDKWAHFSAGAFLVDHAARMRVPLRWAVPLTCAGAWGWEVSQGWISWKDAGASCAGATVAGALRWLERRITHEEH